MSDVDYILKPCPFCGSENIHIDICTTRARCKNCFATGGMVSKLINNGLGEKEALIAAWN